MSSSANQTAPVQSRIEIIDAVRGFALAGVAVVHVIEQYLGGPPNEGHTAALNVSVLDQLVGGLDFFFLTGKFYLMFSLLFGLSFFIQMDRAALRGERFGGRFLWRLVLLFGFGFVHHLIYRGDILMIYAVLGGALLLFYRAPRLWLLLPTALLFLGIGRFVVLASVGSSFFGGEVMDAASPYMQAYYDVLYSGSFLDVAAVNLWGGFPNLIDFEFAIWGRGWVTLGCFLLGLWLGRIRFFETAEDRTKVIKRLIWSSLATAFVCFCVMGVLFWLLAPEYDFTSWLAAAAITAMDWFNLATATVYVLVFVLAYLTPTGERVLRVFAPYGRMALTNYLLQAIIGTFVFYNWGLGYISVMRNTYSALLALAIVGVPLVLSRLWLKYFFYGPLEWLWRSLTYFKRYPLLRRAA